MRTEKEILEVFKKELDSFETTGTKIRAFTQEILQYMPDYFLEKENGRENRIVVHTKSCMVIANELFSLECFREKFTASERDCIRSALLLHDAMLYGAGPEHKKIHDHPEYIATYLQSDKWDGILPGYIRKEIASMVAAHSGQWNKDADNLKLNKPQTECEIFVHMCTHLVSKDTCTVQLPVVVESYRNIYEKNVFLTKELESIKKNESGKPKTDFTDPYC